VSDTSPSPAGEAGAVRRAFRLPICLVATPGGFLSDYDTGVVSRAIEPQTQRFGLDDFIKGWASGRILTGCAAGLLVAGPVSDGFGCRRAIPVRRRLPSRLSASSAMGGSWRTTRSERPGSAIS
jgi:MFS family permease